MNKTIQRLLIFTGIALFSSYALLEAVGTEQKKEAPKPAGVAQAPQTPQMPRVAQAAPLTAQAAVAAQAPLTAKTPLAAQAPQGQVAAPPAPVQYVGEFFDIKVPLQNYLFVKSTLTVFRKRGKALADNPQELENAVWEELVLSYEAYRRGIVVNQEDVDAEIDTVLKDYKATFDRKKDKEAYAKWVREHTNEPVDLFENQVRHIVQLDKLRQRVQDTIDPAVSEKEAHEQFLVEQSSLALELAEFEKKSDADEFFRSAKANHALWDKEKEKRPASFRQPGFVSIIFLMDFWKIPRDAAFKMLALKKGSYFSAQPVYKGYAVCKVLDSKNADESKFAKSKQSYYEKVKLIKKQKGVDEWAKDLKQQARIRVYPLPEKSELSNQDTVKPGGKK